MSLQDLVSDFVARVNNAIQSGQDEVVVYKNKLVLSLSNKLTKLGYFESFEDSEKEVTISINSEKLNKLIRVSKPGQRIYVGYEDMPRVFGGKGFNIVSTSQGVLTNVEAKAGKIGGELVLQVY